MNDRERFIIQFLLRKLNEYSAVVRGEKVTVPKKYMREMGVSDAWIISYRDGVRVPIKEVLENIPKS